MVGLWFIYFYIIYIVDFYIGNEGVMVWEILCFKEVVEVREKFCLVCSCRVLVFWCFVEYMVIVYCFLCCVWWEDRKMFVNFFYFNLGCWCWLGFCLVVCIIMFCFFEIIKELYFSKMICNEGVG